MKDQFTEILIVCVLLSLVATVLVMRHQDRKEKAGQSAAMNLVTLTNGPITNRYEITKQYWTNAVIITNQSSSAVPLTVNTHSGGATNTLSSDWLDGFSKGVSVGRRQIFIQRDGFECADYFSDLVVIKTETREPMTERELTDLIDRQPNVKSVSFNFSRHRGFSLDTLAFPQYAHDYQLTKKEWADLQAFCREKLKEPIAVDEVIQHWRNITNGIVPFRLSVEGTPNNVVNHAPETPLEWPKQHQGTP